MINLTQPSHSATNSNNTTSSKRRIARCEVVIVTPEANDRFAGDLLPWADPYIASLVAALEREEAGA